MIHSAVHRARHDVDCVIHTHTWAGMAISALECGLLPITQTAMRFLKIGYHDYQGVVLDASEQESLLRDLGNAEACVLRNHGVLDRRPHRGRGVQLVPSLRARGARAARRAGHGAEARRGAAGGARGNLEQLPAAARGARTASWSGRRCCASSTASTRATATGQSLRRRRRPSGCRDACRPRSPRAPAATARGRPRRSPSRWAAARRRRCPAG